MARSGDCDVSSASDDSGSHIAYTSHLLAANARALSDALGEQQLRVCTASGGYFIIADVSATQLPDDSFCRSTPPRSIHPQPLNLATSCLTPRRRQLVKHARVGALPLSLFYSDASNPPPKHLVRFSVCKVSTAPQPPHAALAPVERNCRTPRLLLLHAAALEPSRCFRKNSNRRRRSIPPASCCQWLGCSCRHLVCYLFTDAAPPLE